MKLLPKQNRGEKVCLSYFMFSKQDQRSRKHYAGTNYWQLTLSNSLPQCCTQVNFQLKMPVPKPYRFHKTVSLDPSGMIEVLQLSINFAVISGDAQCRWQCVPLECRVERKAWFSRWDNMINPQDVTLSPEK